MKSLLAALGVDYAQWRALTLAALKLDFRVSSWDARRSNPGTRATVVLIGRLLFYTGLGAGMAVVVAVVADVFTAALIVMSYVIVMVGTAMLGEHNATVISPTDHAILGYLPISSRTYFAARLTNVLVYTLGMTVAIGWLPVGAFVFRHGIAAGAAAAIALFACSMSVTLAVVTAYLWLVRRVGVRRLQNVVSYLQLGTGFLIYGTFVVVPEYGSNGTLTSFQLPETPWLLFYPGAWFASYPSLATGSTGVADVLPVLASLAVLALLVTKLRGRLSLEYAEQLAAITTAPAPVSRRERVSALSPGRWFRRGEARAVALLVRAHFRNDLKFRMAVLGILPMTLLYLFIGIRNGDGARPPGDFRRLSMVTLAVLLFPVLLKLSMARSDAYRASWVFFATPADRTRLVRASTHVLIVLFVLPYLAFVGLTLFWFTESIGYLAVYLVLAGTLSYVILLAATCIDPELPFAKPPAKGASSARFFGALMAVGILGVFLPTLARWLYRSVTAAAITFVIVIAINLLLSVATRARVERRAALMEFLG